MSSSSLDPIERLVALCTLALIAAVIVFGVRECNEKRDCRDSGGRVEEYNCHTVMVPMSCGKNCTMIVPTESCDWRCVGVSQ